MSLVGSIFGKEEKATGLTSLFSESSELPEKPQHKAIKRKRKAEQPPKEEEQQPASTKKKRKERKSKQDADTSTTVETTAAASPERQDDNTVEERTIFVGNLPLDTTRKSLASMFKQCGKVESCRLRSVAASGVKLPTERAGDQNLVKKVCANTNKLDTTAKSTAQGYVVFANKDSVPNALKLNNTTVGDGLFLRVDYATPTMDASRSVFVGNLPYQADESSLHKHFVEGCGLEDDDVQGVRIIRDKETMQCKGFGYVLFREQSMVVLALRKMHESNYLKRDLRVTVCGKRFKGKRGAAKNDDSKRRSFEGKRSGATSEGAIKRILGKKTSKSDEKATTKKRRARGETRKGKGGAKSAGISKRAAAEAKAGKRMKKIQKRVSKGMGKARGR